jgi:hypothetical protein
MGGQINKNVICLPFLLWNNIEMYLSENNFNILKYMKFISINFEYENESNAIGNEQRKVSLLIVNNAVLNVNLQKTDEEQKQKEPSLLLYGYPALLAPPRGMIKTELTLIKENATIAKVN